MQNLLSGQPETEATGTSQEISPFLRTAARLENKLRIVLPAMPRRELCVEDRKVRAARRMMEFVLWQASGGDYLASSRAGEFIELAQSL